MADDKFVMGMTVHIDQVTGVDKAEKKVSQSMTKQFKTIQAQMGAVKREFYSQENLLSREMAKISRYNQQVLGARERFTISEKNKWNNLGRVFADIAPHQYDSRVLSRANNSEVFRGKNARYHQATNTGAISASLIDRQFGIGVTNNDLARMKNYYSGLEKQGYVLQNILQNSSYKNPFKDIENRAIKQVKAEDEAESKSLKERIKENIKLYGAGSKSDIRRRQKAFGHLDALSASLLGNDYESRLIRESISNAVGASNASIDLSKKYPSGVSILDYINNKTGVSSNPELARMKNFYAEKEEADLLKKQEKDNKEKKQADNKERRERDRYRKTIIKDIDKISNFIYGWSKALIAGSLAGGVYTLKNWTQGATQTALNREVINSTMGRQYGAGIQNWASMLYKYGGVSREQSYGMFKNLQALYGKALMGDANASKLFGALSIDQLSGDPIKMLRQLIHGFRGLDKATRMDVANQLGISDNALVAFDRMAQMGTASSRDFLATNLKENELSRLTTFGESIREMSDTWKNFKDVMVAHSASLNKEANAISELLQKGIKVIREKKGDFVDEVMKRTADNLNLVNLANPLNWIGRGIAGIVNEADTHNLERRKIEDKKKLLNFIANQPSIGPVSDFIESNAELNPVKYGNSNIEVGGITVNIEAKTEDGRIDTDDFMTKFTSAIGNQLKTTFFNAEDATLNMGR